LVALNNKNHQMLKIKWGSPSFFPFVFVFNLSAQFLSFILLLFFDDFIGLRETKNDFMSVAQCPIRRL